MMRVIILIVTIVVIDFYDIFDGHDTDVCLVNALRVLIIVLKAKMPVMAIILVPKKKIMVVPKKNLPIKKYEKSWRHQVSVRPEGSPAWTQHEVPATQV